MHRTFLRGGLSNLTASVLLGMVGSCGTNINTGPVTGPEVFLPSGGLEDTVSTVVNIPLNCPGFPSTAMLASTASTPGGVLPVVTTISAPEATFLITSVTVPGSFDMVRQLDITITAEDRFVTLVVRAGSSTGGELSVGDFFTDAFQVQQIGNGTGDLATLSNRPTVSIVDGFSRCNSAAGDLLQITALDTDPFATTGGLVRQFQATFRLGCLQGCVSFLQ